MADRFGAITLPAALDVLSDPLHDSVTDPLLDFTLLYFQAVLNAQLGAVWTSVAPGKPVVASIHANDPEQLDFNEKMLPALYAWRAGSNDAAPDRVSEDTVFMRDQVMLFWVPPPTRQAFRQIREQISAGMTKALMVAIELSRHPAWVVQGDTDPLATKYGSVFPRYAGWSEMRLNKWQDRVMTVQMDAGSPRNYPALHATLDVVEEFAEDFTKAIYPPLGGDPYTGGLDHTNYDPTGTLVVNRRVV